MISRGQGKGYMWVCLALTLMSQVVAYFLTSRLIPDSALHDLSTGLDRMIPFRPAWVTVYFLAYVCWLAGGALILSDSRERAWRLTAAYAIAMAISAAIFVAWPGTIQRPEPAGDGFFERWVRWLYSVDAPKNLCPSMHVLATYFCWRGMWGQDRIPGWIKWAGFVLVILVSLSILFIKQHAVVDIPVAVIVAEVALWAGRRLPIKPIKRR